MRHLTYALITLLSVTLLGACTDETIGTSLTDSKTAIIEDSNFTVTGRSVPITRIQAKTSTQLIGKIKADAYGTLQSNVVAQMMPSAEIDTSGVSIDSCRMKFRIPASNGFTGDSLTPMRMSIYRLCKPLPSPMYSDFDPTRYYNTDDLLGSAAYSPQSAISDYDGETSQYYRAVYVPVKKEFALELIDKYRQSPETFKSLEKFQQYFPGIYIANSYGSGRMMNFYHTELEVFYTKHITSEGLDTIVDDNQQSYLATAPETQQDNIIRLNIDSEVSKRVDAGQAIVMAPAGYEVQIQFPIDKIIQHFEDNIGSNLAVINDLEIEIPIDTIGTQYNIKPPANLLFVKTSQKDKFFAGDSLANYEDSFLATYNTSTKSYYIDEMRDYILQIYEENDGIATVDDINLTIVPVDITTYTSQTSYYNSATSTITKIAPQVSMPAIARLRLDKAKVKITFSKQTF